MYHCQAKQVLRTIITQVPHFYNERIGPTLKASILTTKEDVRVMDNINPADHAADEGRQPNQAVQQQAIRSIRCRQRSFVRFVNRTQRTVDVIWIDYKGERQKYKTLSPGEIYKVNTFVTHPWIFRDSETTATLLVNSEEIFYPKPVLQEGQPLFGPASPYHVTAYISIPLFSLKDRAAQVVWSCLADPEEAYKLEIPKVLINTIAKWAV